MNACIFSIDIAKYIGIPYNRGEASFDGCDCWGLLRLFYQTELGTSLPNYKDFAYDKELFSQVLRPAHYNIALIAHDGVTIDHCGMLTAAGLLHSLENTGALLSRVKLWEAKIKGWYAFNDAGSIKNYL